LTDSTDSATPPKSSGSERTPPLPATTEPLLLAATAGRTVGEFPYLETGDQTPKGHAVRRPALGVKLLKEGKALAVARALVDSGADFTTLSDDWAALASIDLERDCEPQKVAIADQRPSMRYAYCEGLTVEVVGEPLFLPVVMFCKGLPIALLGRRDFFDRYHVLFDQRRHRFFLERLPDHDERDEDDPDADLMLAAS
jgi:hypothetical protein